MNRLVRALLAGVFLAGVMGGCASGRVRGAQGTEMGQAQEYEPERKVDPPIGNVDRTSGPLTLPNPYPVLEVDLERQPKPPPGELEPEPSPAPHSTEE